MLTFLQLTFRVMASVSKIMKFLKLVRFSEDVSIFAISLQALKALSRP